MILELTPNTHPILHNKVKPCSVNLDRHFVAKTLVENMHHHDGIGLAANQIGMDVRAFAMIRDLENNEVLVCFNPKIVKKYKNPRYPYLILGKVYFCRGKSLAPPQKNLEKKHT